MWILDCEGSSLEGLRFCLFLVMLTRTDVFREASLAPTGQKVLVRPDEARNWQIRYSCPD